MVLILHVSGELKEQIKGRAEGGVVGNAIKVIEKALTMTDVQSHQNRFSIPVNQMKEELLLPAEVEFLKERAHRKNCNTMEVKIIELSGKVPTVSLRRWVMKKKSRKSKKPKKSSVSYVLKGNWRRMLKENRVQEGDLVQLWAVRIGGNQELCLALVVWHQKNRKKKKNPRQHHHQERKSVNQNNPRQQHNHRDKKMAKQKKPR